jgi:hypothetical protein
MNRSAAGIIGLALAAGSCGGPTQSDVLSGVWTVTAKGMAGGGMTCPDKTSTLELSQDGSEIRGPSSSVFLTICQVGTDGMSIMGFPAQIAGTLDGSSVNFTSTNSTFGPTSMIQLMLLESAYVGQLDSTSIKGTATWTCRNFVNGATVIFTGSFEAVRAP